MGNCCGRDGYAGWIEGNWCWLLPSAASNNSEGYAKPPDNFVATITESMSTSRSGTTIDVASMRTSSTRRSRRCRLKRKASTMATNTDDGDGDGDGDCDVDYSSDNKQQ